MDPDDLLADCDVRRGRASGPGGQHRNKVETAVVITHRDSGCIGEASERRSQEQNRQQAIARLRVRLALAVRHPRDSYPSPRWQGRLRGARIEVSTAHEDFAALLSEALDCLAQHQWDASVAAEQLRCTTSQLVKLLKAEPAALQQLNAHRQSASLPPLN